MSFSVISKFITKYRKLFQIMKYTTKNTKPATPSADYRPPHECCKEKPPITCCRKRKPKPTADPDLSKFGGKPFKTCGPDAYVIQYDEIPRTNAAESDETEILRRIEADPSVKNTISDPMPEFESVEQRLLDLNERRLHPYYRRYRALPKRLETKTKDGGEDGDDSKPDETNWYYCLKKPITADELPKQLQLFRDLLEKKSIYADYKIAELPRQMIVRMMEIERNRAPTLEKRVKKHQQLKKKKKKKCTNDKIEAAIKNENVKPNK